MYNNDRCSGSNFRNQRSGGSNFRGGSSFRGHGGSRSFGGQRPASRRKVTSFDPSMLVAQASINHETAPAQQAYVAQHAFSDFDMHEQIKTNLASKGYKIPTPIQDQIISHILEGKDVVGIAATGTGKTAAFLLPLIDKVVRQGDSRVLVVTPTRELALQIRDELLAFSQQLPVFSTLCIGGSSIGRQVERLARRPAFVVGTPGRLKDLTQRRKLNFSHFDTIVLDEVDRMLDMGFIHDVKAIVDQLPAERQSLFFSATTSKKVEEIMRGFLNNPVMVTVKSAENRANIEQSIVDVRGKVKLEVLHDLLIKAEFQKVLVFGRTKHSMERLTRDLDERGFKVASIHGNKSQGQRQRALQQFRDNRVKVLLATDVVARGLDIKDVTHVINYDLPESYEDYIHRIGRTGRADKTGVALTFVG